MASVSRGLDGLPLDKALGIRGAKPDLPQGFRSFNFRAFFLKIVPLPRLFTIRGADARDVSGHRRHNMIVAPAECGCRSTCAPNCNWRRQSGSHHFKSGLYSYLCAFTCKLRRATLSLSTRPCCILTFNGREVSL